MNKTVKQFIFWAGALMIIFGFGKNKNIFIIILWIFIWSFFFGLIDFVIRSLNRGKKISANSPNSADPRFNTAAKASRVSSNYALSNFLFIFNPFLLIQSLLQTAGGFLEKSFGKPVLDAKQYQQKVNYILPVAGEWRVFNGGVTKETSHSWGIPSQRFAYDLVKFGEDGRSFSGDGRRLEDYFCFDVPILAPADGIVVAARDGIGDAPFVGTFWMDCFTRSIAGNTVLIQHAEGEYCFLAHLKCDSVKVKSGETVKQGQEIGRCGHSGNSTEPHLHFQFQNAKSFYFSSGLPVKFSGFWRRNDGEKNFIEQDYISKNTFISSK